MSEPKSFAVSYAVKRRAKKMAEGGEAFHDDEMHTGDQPKPMVGPKEDHAALDTDADMIARILNKRKNMYSEGGMVANGGDDDLEKSADGKPNEFDDLALDDHLEFSDTGANSGDEIGNEQEDHDRKDIVSRAMSSWKKKDRLPGTR